MPGIGTIVNVASIIVGGILGLLGGRRLKKNMQDSVVTACGISTVIIGLGGAFQEMLRIENGLLTTQGSIMLIMSLVAGSLIGEALAIEERLERFGEWLKQKSGSADDNSFVNGFLTASLTVCIGGMAIVGAIEDGIALDPSILFTKSILDFIIVLLMSASMGKGCIFSAIPLGILQGGMTLLARLIAPVMTEGALSNISFTGSVLIACVGVNLIVGKKFRVGNMLPALIISVAWAFID